MKVKELELGQEVIINSFKYAYKGVNKVRMSGYSVQKIVFKGTENNPDKHFDLIVENKDLKEIDGKLELK